MNPAEYMHIGAQKAEAFCVKGRRQILLVQVPRWEVYAVLHPDEDGFAGLEHIDTVETFEEAKDIADAMGEELLADA